MRKAFFYPVFPALKDYAWGSQDPEGAIGDLLRKNTLIEKRGSRLKTRKAIPQTQY